MKIATSTPAAAVTTAATDSTAAQPAAKRLVAEKSEKAAAAKEAAEKLAAEKAAVKAEKAAAAKYNIYYSNSCGAGSGNSNSTRRFGSCFSRSTNSQIPEVVNKNQPSKLIMITLLINRITMRKRRLY